jgi:5-methylcytosine-specific restriction enzyme subunit McrC
VKTLVAPDLSRLENLTRADERWLEEIAERVTGSEHVVRLSGAAEDPEPIVSRAYDGHWRAGRYIGSISFQGRRLVIEPRLAPAGVRELLRTALNVIVPALSAELERSSMMVPLLLAMVWSRRLDAATRHGLPFLRLPNKREGLYVQGRVDERRTMELRRRGTLALSSTAIERSLDNDIVQTLVCGHRALLKMLGGDAWMTRRAHDVMPHLWAAVGTRPSLPTALAVRRIRYSPIRLQYRGLVEHSWALARGWGLNAGGEGDAEGLLIDMAELWERFVLRCVERAVEAGDDVSHEALGVGPRQYLYRSVTAADHSMGLLLPDIVVRRSGNPVAILDAKYKLVANRKEAHLGVTREDRFQLAAYLSAYRDTIPRGMLVYPAELSDDGLEKPADQQRLSSAEADGPWRGPSGTLAHFVRLSFDPERATAQLRTALACRSGQSGDSSVNRSPA